MNLFSIGNLKLGKDTMIFNMTSATDCPSIKLGLCRVQKSCYAKKAERIYKNCLPHRRNQMRFWDKCTVEEFISEFELNKTKNIKYLRINESGDFTNQSEIRKLNNITKRLFNKWGVKTYLYTARKDLNFKGVSFVVNGSSWMADNNFLFIPKGQIYTGQYVCGGDCRVCNLCKEKNGIVIGVYQH